MFSPLFRLDKRQLINGVIIAVVGAIGGGVYEAAQAGTLDIFTYDWTSALRLGVNAAISYLVTKLLTAENGKVLGKI